MRSFTTFYLSRIIGKKVFSSSGEMIGKVCDLLIENNESSNFQGKLKVNGISLKKGRKKFYYNFDAFTVIKENGKILVECTTPVELSPEDVEKGLLLDEVILDKQIVDLNGRKLVRVNDVRLVSLIEGTYAVAVDIGIEGLLRRIGVAKPIKAVISLFGGTIPSKFILWDDVQAVDYSNLSIKLSQSYSKLRTLHPSDLADIIEELDKQSRTEIFASLDEEQAADVMEELNPEAQIHLIESLPLAKMADVLEKMPADEVADILDNLEEEKAELLLKEMEQDSSEEVRELLEYPDNSVGSIMSTEILSFREQNTVEDVLRLMRERKPEQEELYNLFVTDEHEKLTATFSLRDLVISEPETKLKAVMKKSPAHLFDYQKVDDIAELISKYNLLAIPVIDRQGILQGMVVIDDVVEDLIHHRRTNK